LTVLRPWLVVCLAVAPAPARAQPYDAYGLQLGWRCEADTFRGAAQLGLWSNESREFIGLVQYGLATNRVSDRFAGALQLGFYNDSWALFAHAQIGAINITRGQLAAGLQLGAVNSNTKVNMVLLQVGGLNHTERRHVGLVQLGLANWYRRGEFYGGVQLALMNYAEGGDNGFFGLAQIGVFNYFDPGVHGGLQIGAINVVRLRLVGIGQVGLLNGATTFTGLAQLGVINATIETMRGLQIGQLNWARNVYGAQIGIVNITRRLRGVQLGLLNLSRDGGLPVSLVLNIGW